MREALAINGTELLPISEVVAESKYSPDYIAKLAREGHITGVQVGRQWFIDKQSLAKFARAADLEAQVRNRHLSHERRREREVVSEFKNRLAIVAARPRYSIRRGVTQSIGVVMCGVLSGYVLSATPVLLEKTALLQKAQLLVSEEVITAAKSSEAVEFSGVLSAPERLVFADTYELRRLSDRTEGVLLLPTASTADRQLKINKVFSDPVTVFYTDPGVGRVLLIDNANFSTTSVPFVTVPIGTTAE